MFDKWRSVTLFCSIFLHNLSFINIRKLIISTVYKENFISRFSIRENSPNENEHRGGEIAVDFDAG